MKMIRAEFTEDMVKKLQDKSIKKLMMAADRKLVVSSIFDAYDFGLKVAEDAKGRDIYELFIDADPDEEDESECTLLVFFGTESEINDRLNLI